MKKTALQIHLWPEKNLRKKCKIVKHIDDSIRYLLEQMRALMMVHEGAGLAANQVGLDINLIVIEFEGKIFKLVNSVILKKEGRMIFKEGCLSFPGLEMHIRRAKKVWVSAYDENGQPLTIEADGILAVIFQHEIDHVNGMVFLDRLSFVEKLQALARFRLIKTKFDGETREKMRN